jgi:KDEL-tailed cysteine endopeptidase
MLYKLFMTIVGVFSVVAATNMRNHVGKSDNSMAIVETVPQLNLNETEIWSKFEDFTEMFQKRYDNVVALKERFQIFRDNFEFIVRHNLDTSNTFTLGINQFTDMTNSEFRQQQLSGFKSGYNTGSHCSKFSSSGSNLASALDWVSKGAVTPVRDQGSCGSCYAFSAVEAIESAWYLAGNELLDLSEQQIVDCTNGVFNGGNHGCNGGLMDNVFSYGISTGICTEASYPYTSGTSQKSGSCQSCKQVVKLSGCEDVVPNNQIALNEALTHGPVSIAIDAGSVYFQSYKSGVLTDATKCGTELNHGVLLTGYGVDGSQKYYSIRNSWGTSWGESGYVRVGRSDSTNDGGVCGVAMEPSFPTI